MIKETGIQLTKENNWFLTSTTSTSSTLGKAGTQTHKQKKKANPAGDDCPRIVTKAGRVVDTKYVHKEQKLRKHVRNAINTHCRAFINKLRTVHDKLGEFCSLIAHYFPCLGGMQPICKQKFTRLITEIPDPTYISVSGKG